MRAIARGKIYIKMQLFFHGLYKWLMFVYLVTLAADIYFKLTYYKISEVQVFYFSFILEGRQITYLFI